jgi:hypothetical protein
MVAVYESTFCEVGGCQCALLLTRGGEPVCAHPALGLPVPGAVIAPGAGVPAICPAAAAPAPSASPVARGIARRSSAYRARWS